MSDLLAQDPKAFLKQDLFSLGFSRKVCHTSPTESDPPVQHTAPSKNRARPMPGVRPPVGDMSNAAATTD